MGTQKGLLGTERLKHFCVFVFLSGVDTIIYFHVFSSYDVCICTTSKSIGAFKRLPFKLYTNL